MSNEDKTPFGPTQFFDPSTYQPSAGKSELHNQLIEGVITRANLFRMKQATALREHLADKGADFIKTATLKQIEAAAGDEFAAQSENTKQRTIDATRRADKYAALSLTPEEVRKTELPAFNATFELGRLLAYVAEVATAIRLNSPYRGDYESRDPREVGLDVMWLADSLHCLDRLGRAIQSADTTEIVAACDALLSYYGMFTEGAQGKSMKGDPKATFERYGHLCTPQQAMSVFAEIRGKALAQ
jgi:hypothetical protein